MSMSADGFGRRGQSSSVVQGESKESRPRRGKSSEESSEESVGESVLSHRPVYQPYSSQGSSRESLKNRASGTRPLESTIHCAQLIE